MDAHPTPYPGKRRPAVVKTTKKESTLKNKQSQEAKQTLTGANSRPKRAFGVPRNTNILSEKTTKKPLSSKISKPWKPSGPQLIEAKPVIKNTHNVVFTELADEISQKVNSSEKEVPCDLIKTTPISSVKLKVLEKPAETPYLSAENSSRFKLDQLESASYWIDQIKLAESVGKHFVSRDFFRLALECHAKPLYQLQNELEHYCKMHEAVSMDPLWVDLCMSYRKFNKKLDFLIIGEDENQEVNSDMHKQKFLGFNYVRSGGGGALCSSLKSQRSGGSAASACENGEFRETSVSSKLSVGKADQVDQLTNIAGISDDPSTNIGEKINPKESNEIAKSGITDQGALL